MLCQSLVEREGRGGPLRHLRQMIEEGGGCGSQLQREKAIQCKRESFGASLGILW